MKVLTHFIKNYHLHLIDFGHSFLDEVQNSTRGCNHHMYCENVHTALSSTNIAKYMNGQPRCINGILSSSSIWKTLPVSSSLMMSSRRFVPPVVAITFTPPMCLLTWIHIWLTCRASSLVGTMTNAENRWTKICTSR